MDFIAIDVEIANSKYASICQIGIASFKDGKLVDEWISLINPEDKFEPRNIKKHGIKADDVKDAPTFPEIRDELLSLIYRRICVHHGQLDRNAIAQVTDKYDFNHIETTWLDSTKVVQVVWKEVAKKGFGLAPMCKKVGFDLIKHHNSLEDAKGAGYIMLAAIDKSGLEINEWANQLAHSTDKRVRRQAKTFIDASLFKKTTCFFMVFFSSKALT